jgi:hypothetical protein
LDQDYLVLPLRVLVQEQLERQELLSHAANAVQLIASNYNPLAFVALLHGLNPLQDLRLFASDSKRLRVDTNWRRPDIHEAVLKLDTIFCSFNGQDTTARLEEVVGVLLGLESDQVGSKHAIQELFTSG